MASASSALKKTKISVEEKMQKFMPDYMKNRELDLQKMNQSLINADFETINVTSHKIKGHAALYGLAPLGEICARIERASKDSDANKIKALLIEYKNYFDSVEL